MATVANQAGCPLVAECGVLLAPHHVTVLQQGAWGAPEQNIKEGFSEEVSLELNY